MLNPDLILWGWLPLCLFVYKQQVPKWGIAKTTSVLLVAAALFLPAQYVIKPPGLAHLNKHTFAVLGPYLAIRLLYPAFWRERSRLAGGGWLFVVATLAMIGTVVTNAYPIDEGATHLAPLDLAYFRVEWLDFLTLFYLPWALGQRVYHTAEEARTFMQVLIGGLLIYFIPIAVELRVSPQLHNWVYGYHPFSFVQAVRSGGFRPSVFFNHGLTLAMYQAAALTMAAVLYKLNIRVWRFSGLTVFVLGLVVLALCKSKGALVYLVFLGPAVFLLKPRGQLVIAWCLASVTLMYPVLRANKLIPDEEIVQFATEKFGEERAQSLEFRLVNERLLFERAEEQPVFGWGGDDRSLISDPFTGKVVSVPDGEWILHFGMFGVFGYYARFGLYVLALWAFTRNRKYLELRDARVMGALCLIVAMFVVDQLPNSTSNRLPLIYAAMVYTLCRTLPAQRAAERQALAMQQQRQPPAETPHSGELTKATSAG